MRVTNFGLPAAREMARHTATAINSPDLTGPQARGRLDQPERKASCMERRNWHDHGLTESEERQLMLRLEELAKIEGTNVSEFTAAKIATKIFVYCF